MISELSKNIINLYHQNSSTNALDVETYLEKLLLKDPNNIDLLIRLALAQLVVELDDMYKSIECLERALELKPGHPIATILLAHVHGAYLGGVSNQLVQQLEAVKSNDPEVNSMIAYMISWHNWENQPGKEKEWLIKSINFYQGHVKNYKYLAMIFFQEGDLFRGKKFCQKALSNVKKVYDKLSLYDPTDINEYLGEHIKGIYLSSSNYELLQSVSSNDNE